MGRLITKTLLLSSTSDVIPTVMSNFLRRFGLFRRCFSHGPQSVPCTEDQLQVLSIAEEFSRKELIPYAAKWEAEEQFSIDTMRKAAQLGFSGICVDADKGGCGLGAVEAAIIFEALSYGDISFTTFLTVQNMISYTISRFGTEEQQRKFLSPLLSLEKFGSYCLTEPQSGSDAASLQTSAKKIENKISGDSFVLNGSKAFISGGGLSEIYLLMARTGAKGPRGISAFLLEKSLHGLAFGKKEKKMGWISQPTTSMTLDSVHVPENQLLGIEGQGFKIAMHALDRGRINIAACAVGGAQYCLDAAESYTKTRKQFGKTINTFQNTEFKLAEMATQIQSSRLMVRNAAYSLDHQILSGTVDAAMAKLHATDMSVRVSNEALQLFGGYGYIRDYHVERYVRDLRVMTILEGTNEIMKAVIQKGRQK